MVDYALSPVGRDYQTRRELVHARLRSAILHCHIKPGQKFTIRELAEQLEVSASPVREALSRLEGEGLVENDSSRGFRVTSLSPNSMRDVISTLGALVALCGRFARERMTPQTLKELEALCEEADIAIKRGDDIETLYPLTREFHRATCRASGMPFLAKTAHYTLDRADWLFRCFLLYETDAARERVVQAAKEHWEILAALKKGDPEEVELLTREHNRRALAWYMQHLPQSTRFASSKVTSVTHRSIPVAGLTSHASSPD